MGDYASALKFYVKARELSVTAHKIAEVTLSILELSVLSSSWEGVSRAASRQDLLNDLDAACVCSTTPQWGDLAKIYAHAPSPRLPSRHILLSAAGRVHAAFGLSSLAQSEFAAAASSLQKVPESLGDAFRPAAVDDLGVAAVLASAASGSRAAMRSIMDTPVAQAAFDTFPAARTVLEGMCSGAYGSALAAVQSLSHVLRVDPYIGPVLGQLQAAIRARAINLYCSPYTIVDVRAVIAALGSAGGGGGAAAPSISDAQLQSVEAELTALITGGALAGRIDAVAHTFRAKAVQPRANAYTALLETAALYESEAHSLLLNASLHRARLRLDTPQGERRHRGAGAGAGVPGAAPAAGASAALPAPPQLPHDMADGSALDDDDGGSSSAGGSDAELLGLDPVEHLVMGGGFPDLAGAINAITFRGPAGAMLGGMDMPPGGMMDGWPGSSNEKERQQIEAAAAEAFKQRPPGFPATDIFSDAFSS
jgi:hypothetical protein